MIALSEIRFPGEIKRRLKNVRSQKGKALRDKNDMRFRISCAKESELMWVLKEQHEKPGKKLREIK